MLTPQEVAEHTFHRASFGGYNMAVVDEFLDIVTGDYTALYKENAALKAKMKVLADKVEEYRATEDAMRKALCSAQKMADQMVEEAQAKKDAIVAGAEKEAAGRLAAIRQETENERLRLSAAQSATAAYVARLKELFEHEREYLTGLSRLEAETPQPDLVADAAQAIGDAVEKAAEDSPFRSEDEDPTITREFPAAEREDESEQVRETETGEGTSVPNDFERLPFGRDYEIH